MPQTFQQLLATPSKETLLAQLIGVLKGVGLTTHTGFSAGDLTVSSVPPADATLDVKIIAAGDLGVATFQWRENGGAYSATTPIPADGLVTIAMAGGNVDLVFTAGPVGLDSFDVDDVFTIDLAVPTWPLSAWESASAGLSLIELDTVVLEDLYLLVHDVAAGGLLDYAIGPWLDLLAENLYDLTRTPGTVTEGKVSLADPSSVGPFNLVSGQLVVESLTGLRYILSANVVVPLASGGTVATVRAEQKGDVYNVGNNTITRLVTSVPGLTVNNPVFANGTWITSAGADDESDESLVLRCRAKWASLAVGLPAAMYDTWAKASDPAINRSYARVSPTVAGQVDLYIAGPSGAVGAPVIAACQLYVDERVALTNTCVVASVSNFPQTVTAVVSVFQAYLANATAEVLQAVEALLEEKKGIGATLYLSELYDAIQTVQGVRDVTITVPAGNVELDADEVFVFTNNLSFVGV